MNCFLVIDAPCRNCEYLAWNRLCKYQNRANLLHRYTQTCLLIIIKSSNQLCCFRLTMLNAVNLRSSICAWNKSDNTICTANLRIPILLEFKTKCSEIYFSRNIFSRNPVKDQCSYSLSYEKPYGLITYECPVVHYFTIYQVHQNMKHQCSMRRLKITGGSEKAVRVSRRMDCRFGAIKLAPIIKNHM